MNDDQPPTGEQPPTPDASAPSGSAPQGAVGRPRAGGSDDRVDVGRTGSDEAAESAEMADMASVDDPWLLDRILSGEAGERWTGVAELLRAASAPPRPAEVHGERAAVHAFVTARQRSVGRHASGRRAPRGARRLAVMSTLVAGKFAAVSVAGVVTLGAGGMAAAAYTGMLPGPLQDVAHRTIGAPLPDHTSLQPSPTGSPTPTGSPSASPQTATGSPSSSTSAPRASASRTARTAPAPTGSTSRSSAPAVADLCLAWTRQTLPTTGAGVSTLSKAAGSSSIDDFCASLASPTTRPTTTPTGEPTSTPSETASPTTQPTTPPATASDEPTPPPVTASDQPGPSPTGAGPGDEPTGRA